MNYSNPQPVSPDKSTWLYSPKKSGHIWSGIAIILGGVALGIIGIKISAIFYFSEPQITEADVKKVVTEKVIENWRVWFQRSLEEAPPDVSGSVEINLGSINLQHSSYVDYPVVAVVTIEETEIIGLRGESDIFPTRNTVELLIGRKNNKWHCLEVKGVVPFGVNDALDGKYWIMPTTTTSKSR